MTELYNCLRDSGGKGAMVNVFLSFAGGEDKWFFCLRHLRARVEETGIFDLVLDYTPDDLPAEFLLKHGAFIEENKRGYGYWIWKPYLILKQMERMNDGDRLLFLDAGCDLIVSEKAELVRLIELVKTDLIIGSLFPDKECKWSKMDLISYLRMKNDEALNSYQYQGGVVLFYKCETTMRFLKEWYETCCFYHLLDDSPSFLPNDPLFCEHRHDQSVFSLLMKRYKIQSIWTLPGACIKIWANPYRS